MPSPGTTRRSRKPSLQMLTATFLVSLATGLLVTPGVIRLAESRNWLDVPTDGRRVHKVPIPRLGGIAVFVSLLVGLFAAGLLSAAGGGLGDETQRFLLAILLGGGLLFLVGLVDDLRGVSAYVKIGAQSLAGAVFFALGVRIETLSMGGGSALELGFLALPFTVLWIVVVTNAFNLIDGLDGLASGIAMVALAATAGLAVLMDRSAVLIVSLSLLGGILGFLRYNFRPARIFLGDSGSMFIGCMLAVLSVHGSTKSATAMLSVAPLFLLAVPLIDACLAFLRRWLRGVSFDSPDKRHIHHQLLARGLTHLRAVLTLYVVACALAVIGIVITFVPTTSVALIAIGGGIVSLVILLWGLGYLDYHEFFEAGSVLALAPLRVRKVIRDQIHARDVARVLQLADSLEEINAVLTDNAGNFEFLDMAVCRESERRRPLVIVEGHTVSAPRMEYPVSSISRVSDDPWVLRIWCRPEHARPAGSERVAGILGPVIRAWLTQQAEVRQVSEVAPRSVKIEAGALEALVHR